MDSTKGDAEPQRSTEPFAELLNLPRGSAVALLFTDAGGPTWLFSEPLEELRLEPSEWAGAFAQLEGFLARHTDRKCVGFLGYDLRDDVEELPRTVREDMPWPCLHVAAFGRAQVWQREELILGEPPPMAPARDLRAHTSRADYECRVAQVVEHIRAGDIFQANLTQPFTAKFDDDPRLLFWHLCQKSPAPFAAYFESAQGEAVLCSSPEEFLHVDGRSVRTRPIKGTRPRAADPEEDRRLLAELLASEKDQAELAMIVDLLRNDLGKVAVPGSVTVGPFPENASYAQVHHTFATVRAELRADVSMAELLRATFPGGSITGAPKLRAMEIIESLELCRRGVYTGAIGWIGPGSHAHLNIAIRTMVHRDGVVRFNTGGGITADSVPELEYEETLHKAAGMMQALGAWL